MSKKFIADHFQADLGCQEPFEIAWPSLSPKADAFSLLPGLKEMEARALKEVREKTLLIEKEAYEKGFEQGERDGRELGMKRLDIVIHQMKHVLLDIERQRKELLQTYEKEIVRLMLNIGKRIFRRELLFHEEVIASVLQEAFQYVTNRGQVLLRLHPGDYRYLSAHPEQAPFLFNENEGVKLIEDPSITRGGCLLETSHGEVDATFESQFDEIVSQIEQQMDEPERHVNQ